MIYYLDNAATTFPKPKSVYSEVSRCISEYCGNPGRSSHSLSMSAARKIYECRCLVADMFGASDPENVIFTLNTTYALNMAIKGLVNKGDHVLISDLEHNAVLRPIHKLREEGYIEYDVFPSLVNSTRRSPTLICAKIASLLKKNTRMVVCTQSSNICSASMPIAEIGEFCRKRGIYFVVDAAQSAGHKKIDVERMNISALCAPSHKGLYGIQGGGLIILGKDVSLNTLIEGGNGVNSLEAYMPDFSPERYESGTLSTPTIAGLCEGLRTVNSIGINTIANMEAELFLSARENLGNINGINLYAPSFVGPVLLFNKDGFSSEELARELDKSGICVRGGFHCSALGHKTLLTPEHGAVRISFGIFNTKNDIDSLAIALNKLKK